MLKHVSNISDPTPSQVIENNLVSFFDYGFLDIGAYISIDIDDMSHNGTNLSLFNKVADARHPLEVWQGNENWVYESGLTQGTPFTPEVYIDGVLEPSPTVDYLNGRVYAPVGTTSVKVKYSYKWVYFTNSRNSLSPLRLTSNTNIISDINVPLPVVSFHVPPISNNVFNEMGRLFASKKLNHTIECEIFAASDADGKKIADIICQQSGYSMPLYCLIEMQAADDSPLNLDGTINSGKNHLELQADYPWTCMKFESITSKYSDYIAPKIHKITLQMKTCLILCGCGC